MQWCYDSRLLYKERCGNYIYYYLDTFFIDRFIDLGNYKISTELMKIVNKSIAYKHCIFPYKENERELFVAMNNPLDSVALNDLRFISQKNIIPSKANKKQIFSYIKLFYEIKDGKKAVEEIEADIHINPSMII